MSDEVWFVTDHQEEKLRRAILEFRVQQQLGDNELIRLLHVGHATLIRLLSGGHVSPAQAERIRRTLGNANQ